MGYQDIVFGRGGGFVVFLGQYFVLGFGIFFNIDVISFCDFLYVSFFFIICIFFFVCILFFFRDLSFENMSVYMFRVQNLEFCLLYLGKIIKNDGCVRLFGDNLMGMD